MKLIGLSALLLMLAVTSAKADIITEFGGGVKLPSTSVLMLEECHEAQITVTRPDNPSLNYRTASCGGDNPVFVGWPIAYERDFGVWSVRAGWFHLSHWFDGKADRELHMDCACVTATINWTERMRKKRAQASR